MRVKYFQNKCCGLYGPMDYDHYLKPASCCGYLDSREHCYNARQTGCEHILMMYYNKFSKILAGTAIGLGCLQVYQSSLIHFRAMRNFI